MQKNLYEIFDEFKQAKTELERRRILIRYNGPSFYKFLQLAFGPTEFMIETVPEYRPLDMPPGMGYSNYAMALKKMHLFVNSPVLRKAPMAHNLTHERRIELFTQFLESLEGKEAEIFAQLISGTFKVPFLTKKLLAKTFPNEVLFKESEESPV